MDREGRRLACYDADGTGEVTSALALSCAYQLGDGVDVAAYSARGVVLGDGTTRPSYDVMFRSAGRPVALTAPEQGTLR
jgi:hypothetical protein